MCYSKSVRFDGAVVASNEATTAIGGTIEPVLRDRAVVARQAHNLDVMGSSPIPETNNSTRGESRLHAVRL